MAIFLVDAFRAAHDYFYPLTPETLIYRAAKDAYGFFSPEAQAAKKDPAAFYKMTEKKSLGSPAHNMANSERVEHALAREFIEICADYINNGPHRLNFGLFLNSPHCL